MTNINILMRVLLGGWGNYSARRLARKKIIDYFGGFNIQRKIK
jgi:hypothetical protein